MLLDTLGRYTSDPVFCSIRSKLYSLTSGISQTADISKSNQVPTERWFVSVIGSIYEDFDDTYIDDCGVDTKRNIRRCRIICDELFEIRSDLSNVETRKAIGLHFPELSNKEYPIYNVFQYLLNDITDLIAFRRKANRNKNGFKNPIKIESTMPFTSAACETNVINIFANQVRKRRYNKSSKG